MKSTAKVTKYESLPIDKVYVGQNQERKEITMGPLKELAESIKKHGLLQPILVHPDKDGTYEVLLGQRRLRAYQAFIKDEKTIMCGVLTEKFSPIECKLISFEENHRREAVSHADAADVVKEIYKAYGSQEAVVSKTGLTKAEVQKYVIYERLPKEMQKMVDSSDLGIDDAIIGWDLASETNDGDVKKAIQHARDFGMIASAKDKKTTLKVAKENKKSVKDANKLAKKIKKYDLKLSLENHLNDALVAYASANETEKSMAAYDIISSTLSNEGFLDESE